MYLKAHSHIECIINGHRFTGWASDDPPYDFEQDDAAEYEEGADGGLYGLGRPRLGGTFIFKMQPAAPTAQWAMQQEQLRKNSHKMRQALRVYSGSFSDPVQNVHWTMSGGGILMLPAMCFANVTYEGRLRFEELTAGVDGGVFHPPLHSDGA